MKSPFAIMLSPRAHGLGRLILFVGSEFTKLVALQSGCSCMIPKLRYSRFTRLRGGAPAFGRRDGAPGGGQFEEAREIWAVVVLVSSAALRG